jgi:hypothetical protein
VSSSIAKENADIAAVLIGDKDVEFAVVIYVGYGDKLGMLSDGD